MKTQAELDEVLVAAALGQPSEVAAVAIRQYAEAMGVSEADAIRFFNREQEPA
jgi:DNA-binding MurR/RpiR family transcriptional regulator